MSQKQPARINLRWLIVGLTILSRIPFILTTYGTDPNAWRMAHSGLRLAAEGFYQVSRLPGFPVPEIFASLIVPKFGALGLNFVSMLLGAGAVNYFYKICEKLKVPRPDFASLAFAFVPVFFLSSITSLDYVWSLFFFVAALYATLSNRPLLAGVGLGLAIGSRLTYGVLLVPLALITIVSQKNRRSKIHAVSKLLGAAVAVGSVCFVPVVKTYNFSVLLADIRDLTSTHFHWDQPAAAFGTLGLMALAMFAIFRILGPRVVTNLPTGWVLASVVTYLICLPAALILPEGPIYLLPALPFLIVQIFSRSPQGLQWLITGLMVLSPFLLRFEEGEFKVNGVALHERSERLENGKYLLKVANRSDLNAEKRLLITGKHFAELAYRFYESGRSMPGNWREWINLTEIQGLKNTGSEIYFLKGQDEYIRAIMGFDLKAEGARELEIDPSSPPSN